jgi:DUF971 family protein
MDVYPTSLRIEEPSQLLIDWSDGQTRKYTFSELREYCPCATCRERREGRQARPATELPVLSAGEARPLRITSMKPVGSYAYSIAFSDGHDTGIYTLEQLHELGAVVPS